MTSRPGLELRCSRDLALRLGAVGADSPAHHRAMRDAGDMLVRDRATGWPLFWPLQITSSDMAATRLGG